MGGGGAGAISHSAYMENAHKDFLNHTGGGVGGDTTSRSIVTVMNTALTVGSSPFLGTTTYNPDTALTAGENSVASFKTAIETLNYTVDYTTVLDIAKAAISADTATLDTMALDTTALDVAILGTDVVDTATLDVAVLDAFPIDDAAVTSDVLAFAAEQEDQLNNVILPRFKLGMLNVNAITSSTFVLGESQLRAFKARDVARYNGDLRMKLSLQAGEMRGKFMSERREIDARFKLQFAEITSKFKIQHKDKEADYRIQFNDHTRQYKMQYQELTQRYKIQFQDLTARYKTQFAEITSRHKQQRQVHIQASCTLMIQELLKRSDLLAEVMRFTVEFNRLKIIAKTEQAQENLLILEHDRRWDLEVFQYGTAVLGGIGGGAFLPGKKSKAVSALAGALGGTAAGATAGAAIGTGGGPYGAAIGAVLGATAGYLSA